MRVELMNILKQSITAVIEQGERSAKDRLCLYRHYNLKCAVGHLIADEHYTKAFENKVLNFGNKVHIALNASVGYEVSEREIGYLKRILSAHDDSDGSDFVSDFKERILEDINNEVLPKKLREVVS